MNRIHGKHGSIKLDPTGVGGPTAVVVASMKSFTIDMSTDTADVTSFGDTNKTYVVGLPDLKGNLGGFWDSDDPDIFDVAMGGKKGFLELIPDTTNATFLWHGLAFLNMSIDVASDGAVTSSGNYVAAGPWTRMPAAA